MGAWVAQPGRQRRCPRAGAEAERRGPVLGVSACPQEARTCRRASLPRAAAGTHTILAETTQCPDSTSAEVSDAGGGTQRGVDVQTH